MRRLVLWLVVFPLDPYPPNVAAHDRMSFSEYNKLMCRRLSAVNQQYPVER